MREHLQAADAAYAMAQAVGHRHTIAQAGIMRAVALRLTGTSFEGLRAAAEALPIAEEIGDPDLQYLALQCTPSSRSPTGISRAPASQLAQTLERLRPVGNPVWITSLHAYLTLVCFQSGDWEAASEHSARALALVRAGDVPHDAQFPLIQWAELLLAQGRWEGRAECLLREADTASADTWDLTWLGLIRPILADLEVQRGNPEAAVAWIEPLVQDPTVEIEFCTILRLHDPCIPGGRRG